MGMRFAVLLILLATPVAAWRAEPGAVCTLRHTLPDGEVVLTYDPTGPVYAITVRQAQPWPQSPWFAIRFAGPRGLVISTPRHILSEDATALSVTDTGFDNVLDGLEFNDTATAFVDGRAVEIPLAGAAPAVRQFRACTGGAAV